METETIQINSIQTSSSLAEEVTVRNLGLVSFDCAREIQKKAVEECYHNQSSELLIFCEHLPTLSLGRSADSQKYLNETTLWSKRGVEVITASRGGKETFHAPGQLVVYPVINLRRRQLGVKQFVEISLGIIASALNLYGIKAVVDLCNPGVWVSKEPGERARKIAAVGLKIEHGITSHGFSVNIDCDLIPFSWFSPCGIKGVQVTSLAEELGYSEVSEKNVSVESFSREVERLWLNYLNL
jgi:lipoate-protein ligase B